MVAHLDTQDLVIKRGLSQIDETSKRLVSKTAHAKDVAKHKGRSLLATKGFDAEKLSRDLKAISLKTYEPLEPLPETGIQLNRLICFPVFLLLTTLCY